MKIFLFKIKEKVEEEEKEAKREYRVKVNLLGLITTPCSEKYLPFKKRKKQCLSKEMSLRNGICIEPFTRHCLFNSQNGIYFKYICLDSLLRQGTNI